MSVTVGPWVVFVLSTWCVFALTERAPRLLKHRSAPRLSRRCQLVRLALIALRCEEGLRSHHPL